MTACQPVDSGQMAAAVERARASSAQMAKWGWVRPEGRVIVNNERPQGFTAAGLSSFKATAWDEPATPPLLPWSPPTGHQVGRVEIDGSYTAICSACQPVPGASN